MKAESRTETTRSAAVDASAVEETAVEESAAEPKYQLPVGEALVAVRLRAGYSIESAALKLGITTRHLLHIEAGLRTPNPELLADFEELYGLEFERLESRTWATRIPPRYDLETNTLWLGWLPIEADIGDNEKLVRSIAAALRTMRSLNDHQPLYLRGSEFPVLSPLFDLEDLHLPFYFMRYLHQTFQEASWLYTSLCEEAAKVAERRKVEAEANLNMVVARALA